MGFIPDIERICKLVPFTRQTLFFTATMPPEIQRITEQFLHNPVRVEVSRPATTVATTTQRLVKTGREPHDKRDTLRRLIRAAEGLQERDHLLQPQARGRAAAPLAACKHGFSAVALHGDWTSRRARRRSTSSASGEVTLLVASDVAARGLDIPDVSHVFNFDVPHHPDDYVHRIGRTGRAGRSGAAVTIVAPADGKVGRGDREADRPDDRLGGRAAGRDRRRGAARGTPWPPRRPRRHGREQRSDRAHRPTARSDRTRERQHATEHADRPHAAEHDRQPSERPRAMAPRPRRAPARASVASLEAARPRPRPDAPRARTRCRTPRTCRRSCSAVPPQGLTPARGKSQRNQPLVCDAANMLATQGVLAACHRQDLPQIHPPAVGSRPAGSIVKIAQGGCAGPCPASGDRADGRSVGRARTHDGVRRDRARPDQGAAPAGRPAQLRGLVQLRDRLQSVAQQDDQRDAGDAAAP